MKKIKEAQTILKALGLAAQQQNEMSALTLLALADLKPRSKWSDASKKSLTVTKGVMVFVKDIYKREYAPNTRETFRRFVLHQFTQAGVTNYNPDAPDLPVNSPRAHYALTDETLQVLRSFGTKEFEKNAEKFRKNLKKRQKQYLKARDTKRIPLKLPNGTEILLSPGKHNEIEVAIVHEFGARFAKGASLLYLGDTENKEIFFERKKLEELGAKIVEHGKFPDVILFQEDKKWLYLIEAVSSHGPVSQKRVQELQDIFPSSDKYGIVFVSAFPDFNEFKKHIKNIAWDTEVWLVDSPDHLIHFNGDRFMGPR